MVSALNENQAINSGRSLLVEARVRNHEHLFSDRTFGGVFCGDDRAIRLSVDGGGYVGRVGVSAFGRGLRRSGGVWA